MKRATRCSLRLLTVKLLCFCRCRKHQIEDPSKDWDKGLDFRGRVIPVWQILWPDALRLPGPLSLRNPEQRAHKALNINLPPVSFFLPPRPIHPFLRPPPLSAPGCPTTGPGNNMTLVSCHESSSCLVDAWSSPPLAWPYSTVSPDPHCPCSCSSGAALHFVSGVTDGKPNSVDVCCSCMPFGWLCPPSSSLRKARLFYRLTFSPSSTFFCLFFFSSPPFVRFAFCLADKLWHFLFCS